MTPYIFVGLTYDTQRNRAMGIPEKSLTARRIIEIVSDTMGVNIDNVISKSREKDLVISRQIAIFHIKRHTILSLNGIGLLFSGRDHATIIYALQIYDDLYGRNKHFTKCADLCKLALNQI